MKGEKNLGISKYMNESKCLAKINLVTPGKRLGLSTGRDLVFPVFSEFLLAIYNQEVLVPMRKVKEG